LAGIFSGKWGGSARAQAVLLLYWIEGKNWEAVLVFIQHHLKWICPIAIDGASGARPEHFVHITHHHDVEAMPTILELKPSTRRILII